MLALGRGAGKPIIERVEVRQAKAVDVASGERHRSLSPPPPGSWYPGSQSALIPCALSHSSGGLQPVALPGQKQF